MNVGKHTISCAQINFSFLGYQMRSDQIESLLHVIQGTVTGKSRNFLKDKVTDSRLLSVSGPG